jgi:hypothetical protein
LASLPVEAAAVDSTLELQAFVDVYATILSAADGVFNSGANTITASQLTSLGLPTLSTSELSMFKSSLDLATTDKVDTWQELHAFVAVVREIHELSLLSSFNPNDPNASTLSDTDFALLGIRGVTEDNLDDLLKLIAQTFSSSVPPTLAGIKALVNGLAALADGQRALVDLVEAYDGSADSTAAIVLNYSAAGLDQVQDQHLGGLNRVFLALEDPKNKDSFGEVKTLVNEYFNAYALLEAAADGDGATPSVSNPFPALLSVSDFAHLGLDQLDSDVEVKLANDLISHLTWSDVAHSDQQVQLANLVGHLLALAAGQDVADQISLAALQQAGIQVTPPESLYAFTQLVAASSDDGSDIDSVAKLQQLAIDAAALQAGSLAQIQAYAAAVADALPSPAPTAETFALAGVLGVTALTEEGLLSVLASTPIGAVQVQSLADLQDIADAVLLMQTDATLASRQTHETLGLSLGAMALPADPALSTTPSDNALRLFNDVVANSFASTTATVASLDTFDELQAMANLVDALYGVAAGPAAAPLHPVAGISMEALAMAGLDMLDPISLEAFLQLVNRTAADGSGLNSYEALLALAQQAILQGAAIRAISDYAETHAGPSPALTTYLLAGVTGLNAADGQPNTVLLRAVNEALLTASVNGAAVDTTAEIQAVVDAYSRILLEANGTAPDASEADPSAADFRLIGATVAAGLSPQGLSVLNDVIGSKTTLDVDSVREIEALATTVAALGTLQSDGSWSTGSDLPAPLTLDAPTLDALNGLGINGLTAADLPAFFEALAALPSADAIDSLAKLQALSNRVIEANALSLIRNFANTHEAPLPTLRDYNVLGISGIAGGQLDSFNDALATMALTLDGSDATAKQQVLDMVAAFQLIFTEANGQDMDVNPLIGPERAHYLAIGSVVASTLLDGSAAQKLLTDVLGARTVADVDRVAKIDALARVSAALIAAADSTTPAADLTPEDLALMGLQGVNTFVLQQLLIDIAATADDGSAVDSLAKLQSLIDARTDRMPALSGVALAFASKTSASGFVTHRTDQTITASLDAVLDINRYRLYGRVDGEGSTGLQGWVDLTQQVTGSQLNWTGATLDEGTGRSIQLKLVDTQTGAERESAVLNRAYRYLDPAVFAAITPAPLELKSSYPMVDGVPQVPAGALRLALSVAAPAETGEIRLYLSDSANPTPIEIASLYHAATRSLIPLYPLPEGEWEIHYRMFDLAGSASGTSGNLALRIVSPQNMLSQEDPYSYGLGAGSTLLEAISRDAVSVAGTNTALTIDANGSRLDAITQLNRDGSLNADGALRAEIQIDNVAIRPDSSAIALAQQDVDTRFGAGQHGDFVFKATDVIMFRLYPQVVAQDGSVVDAANREQFARKVTDAYTGAMHQVDLKIAEGIYTVSDYKVTYYKTLSDGSVIPFDWDPETGTGATFHDSNSDGSYDLITLFIRDGGRGDVDGQADGVILDPGFAVFFQVSQPVPVEPELPAAPVEPELPAAPVEPELPAAPLEPVMPKEPDESQKTPFSVGFIHQVQMALSHQRAPESALIDLNALGFDIKGLDTPLSNWVAHKGTLPQNTPSLLSPDTAWMNLFKSHNAWDKDTASNRNWMQQGQNWEAVPPMPGEPVVPVTLNLPDLPDTEAVYTGEGGFPVKVTHLNEGRLGVLRGQPDQIVQAGETKLILIGSDAFTHISADAQVGLHLSLANGKALPDWIRFNGQTGQLLIQPPAGIMQELHLHLSAIDQEGEQASTVFVLQVQTAPLAPDGRMSFSEKLRQSSSVTLSASMFFMGSVNFHGQN